MPIIRIDLRLTDVEFELWALSEQRTALEENIRYLTAQDRVRTEAQLREAGASYEAEEVQQALEDHDQRVQHVLPRYLRGSFIVAVIAVFETAVDEIADHLRKHSGAQLRLSDIRGDLIERTEKYFRHVLGHELFPDDSTAELVKRAVTLRNAYAHANGRLDAVFERDLPKLREWVTSGVGLSEDHGFIIPSEAFAESGLDAVQRTLTPLIAAVKAT
jgi:hypothetical protein